MDSGANSEKISSLNYRKFLNDYNLEARDNFVSQIMLLNQSPSINETSDERLSSQNLINTTRAQPPSTVETSPKPNVKLLDQDVWRKFHEVNNEMIVTKGGRFEFCCSTIVFGKFCILEYRSQINLFIFDLEKQIFID